MEIYDIDELQTERKSLLSVIVKYVESDALHDELHHVELRIFRFLLALGLCLLKEVLARHGIGKSTTPIHDTNGDVLYYHSVKSRRYLSIFGLIKINRAYYRDKNGNGFYPLDARLNLPSRRYSYLLQQWTQSEIAETTYDHATGGLSDLLGIGVWKRGQEDVARECTDGLRPFYDQKSPPPDDREGSVLCITADCKGVRMVPSEKPDTGKPVASGKARLSRGDKRCGLRRDAVVTSDYTFNPRSRTPEEVVAALMKTGNKSVPEKRQGQPLPREPQNKQTFAHMNGKTAAFEFLADRISCRDPASCKPIYIQIDGALALEQGLMLEITRRGWNRRVSGICLDIIHVMEYVWEAGTALYGEKGKEREPWVSKTALEILRGKVGYVVGGLKQRLTKDPTGLRESQKIVLKKVIRYFENHRHMMRYDVFLKAGYPIATGVIEGACGSLVKERTDCSGMRWTKKGVQAVLDLRALKRNGDWDNYWKYHIDCEKQRLYAA